MRASRPASPPHRGGEGAQLCAAQRPPTRAPQGGVRVVYVSPLKALSYDIERNLRAPLRGVGADVKVGIRTGDTSQAERAAMTRKPPDILITTPESLYLILGSRARTMLRHGGDGDRGRDPRSGLDQAWGPSRAHLGAPGRARAKWHRAAKYRGWACRPPRIRSRRSAASWSVPSRKVRSSTRAYASRWTYASTCRSTR